MKRASCWAVLLTLGCSSSGNGSHSAPVGDAGSGESAAGGTVSNAGGGASDNDAGGTTAGGAGAAGASTSASGLPVPTGTSNLPAPAGTPGNLHILSWAGFKAAVSYTFDDAQPSHIEHWQELKATGVRGTFYLNTLSAKSEAGFDTTWQDAVKQGWELGNHTVHHCYANMTCTNGATFTTFDEEWDDVTSYIKTVGGQSDVWTAAYPFGDSGYEASAKTRFLLARGTNPGFIAANSTADAYDLPCIAAVAAGGEPASTFSADIDSARSSGQWLVFLFHTIMPTTANWYAPTDIASITGSIQHAQAASDVWLDSVVDVGAYWLGQKLVGASTPSTDANGMTWSWTLPPHFPSGKFLRFTVDGGVPSQQGTPLPWHAEGFYELALDAGSLTLSP